MSSLLTDAEVAAFGTIFSDHFSTFKRAITVHKEPDKIISTTPSTVYAGYGNESTESTITYVEKKQTFMAIIIWDDEQSTANLDAEQTLVGVGEVRIKVEQDCRDYINTDRTLSINVDGREFNILSYDKTQFFCGVKYYIYKLDNAN